MSSTEDSSTGDNVTPELEECITISAIGAAQPPGYIRTIFAFPYRGSIDDATHGIQCGVEATASKWPHLKGRVEYADTSEWRGIKFIRLSRSDKIHTRVQTLSKEKFPVGYAELLLRRVPIYMLEEEVLCAVPGLTIPAPITVIQANFLEGGGLLLSICFHHCVVDGEGSRIIIEKLARSLRSHEVPPPHPCTRITEIEFKASDKLLRRHPVYKSWEEAEKVIGSSSSSPWIVETPQGQGVLCKDTKTLLSPNIAMRDRSEPNAKANLLVTRSCAKLKSLKLSIKETLASRKDVDQSVVDRLSTNDCLAALLGNGITRVKKNDLTSLQSNFMMAVDGRTRTVPPIGFDYVSAAVIHSIATEDVDTIQGPTGPDRLGLLALSIRKSIQAVDDEYIAQTVSLVNSFPDLQGFGPRKTKNDLMMTTWEKFAFQDVDFGPYLGKPQWVRKPWSPIVADIVVLPKSRASSQIEVVCLLTNAQASLFIEDMSFMAFVEHHSL